MIVRELVAVLGLDIDDRSFQEADQKFSALTNAAKAFGTVLVSGVVARGLKSFVDRAGEVEDVSALMDTVFADNANAVRSWANTMASEVGRSEFQLRDFASRIGALTAPILGTGEATRELSQDMSVLATDLASVFSNVMNDEEALMALSAGLRGETEPLKRVGISLIDTNLNAFALAQGMNKTTKEMTEAEKVQLRYAYIMERTALFHGTAARELSQYNNAYKFMTARFDDLATKIGQALLPAATRMVHIITAAVDTFLQLAEGSKVLETALIVLGGIATVVGIKMLLPFLPAIAAAAALAAAVGAVILVVDDLWIFFAGGESIAGRVLARLGISGDRVRGVFARLGDIVSGVWDRIKERAQPIIDEIVPAMGRSVDWLADKFTEFLDWVEPKMDALLNIDVDGAIKAVGDFFSDFGGKVNEFVRSPAGKVLVTLLATWAGKKAGDFLGVGAGKLLGGIMGQVGKTKYGPGAGKLGKWAGEGLGGFLGDKLGGVAGMAVGAASAYMGLSASVPRPAGGATSVQQTTNAPINVYPSPGMDEKDLASKIADGVRAITDQQHREAQAHLTYSHEGI